MPSGVWRVAAQLEKEHATVAVKDNLSGLLNEWFGQYRLHAIARRQPEPCSLGLGRERDDGRAW